MDIVQRFVRAERLGDWSLHLQSVRDMIPFFHAAGHLNYARSSQLYCQQMEDLEEKMSPEEFEAFTTMGAFTVRRKGERWSGVWTDMTIEQSLMRPMKSKGGLTHGRGVTDSTIARFIYSFPGCLPWCDALEEFTGVRRSSSEQHVEMRDSRRKADTRDAETFLSWLEQHSPWDTSSSCLRSLSSGVVGDETVNCYKAAALGEVAIKETIGRTFGEVKLSRKYKALTLQSMSGTVKVRDQEVPVNTTQLLWRILCVIQGPEELETYLSYELAPRPPALFDEGGMRRTAKSVLLQKFDHDSPPDEPPKDSVSVVDGGYLLRKHRWPRPATFGQIADSYTK